jgi:hypothetical protein
MVQRKDVRQGVHERMLVVSSALAGEQRRRGPALSTALKFGLRV